MSDDTFVIGDVHGHLDWLTALLQQEGLLSKDGDRLRPEVEVVQLGDFGHWGYATEGEDAVMVGIAPPWLDVMLWGNHDRALAEEIRHSFGGYRRPENPAVIHQVLALRASGKLKLAHTAHGYLFTHAGLHPSLLTEPGAPKDPTAEECAAWLNQLESSPDREPARDNISHERGGPSFFGGILWRDAKEALAFNFPQVFGHTAHPPKVRTYRAAGKDQPYSYCIDIGDKGDHGELAGLWLPSETIAEVSV
jgi:hypothetical protein